LGIWENWTGIYCFGLVLTGNVTGVSYVPVCSLWALLAAQTNPRLSWPAVVELPTFSLQLGLRYTAAMAFSSHACSSCYSHPEDPSPSLVACETPLSLISFEHNVIGHPYRMCHCRLGTFRRSDTLGFSRRDPAACFSARMSRLAQ